MRKLKVYVIQGTSVPTGSSIYDSYVIIADSNDNQIAGPFLGSAKPQQSRAKCGGNCTRISPGSYYFEMGKFPFNPKKGQARYKALHMGTIPAVARNKNNGAKLSMTGIWFHKGGNTRTGSEGCLTIRPSDWPNFINTFTKTDEGTVHLWYPEFPAQSEFVYPSSKRQGL